jgi:hypothetical protein
MSDVSSTLSSLFALMEAFPAVPPKPAVQRMAETTDLPVPVVTAQERNAALFKEWSALLAANPEAPPPPSWMSADPLPSPWGEMLGTALAGDAQRKEQLWRAYAAQHQRQRVLSQSLAKIGLGC